MKKTIITAALLSVAAPSLLASKLTMEEHVMQATLQIQEAKELRGATIVTVGDEVTCDFRLGSTRIQDAINSGADEIRIAASTYDENLTIDDISVSLTGGYANCDDAANDVSNGIRQLISGEPGSGTATILINGDTQRNTVNLTLLDIQDGEAGFVIGGGVSSSGADLALTLDRVNLSGNVGSLGGGLSIVGGDADVTMLNTLVNSNSAVSGGGIFCSGENNSIFINDSGDGASGVLANSTTSGDGGGALITSSCTLSSFSGRPASFFIDARGFVSNTATGNGGGIAVTAGASATLNGGLFCFFVCTGDNTRPVNVDFNTADSDDDGDGFGGGVYVSGENSTVSLFNTVIKDNKGKSGGGIAAEDQATLNMRSLYPFGTCWNEGSCSELRDNITDTAGVPVRGGGMYATTGATVNISNTLISGNRADFGTAIYTIAVDGDPAVTSLDVEGSLIVNNGENGAGDFSDNNAIRINGSNAKLDFNTISDNDLGGVGAVINNTGDLDLFSSIIHDDNNQDVYTGGGTLTQDCLMVNETDSLPADAQTILDDPEFVDRANGDFHLNAAVSPAIDFCDTIFSTPDFNDSDNDIRGFDDPLATNFLGSYDVGYDETYDNDIIFEDDFEG